MSRQRGQLCRLLPWQCTAAGGCWWLANEVASNVGEHAAGWLGLDGRHLQGDDEERLIHGSNWPDRERAAFYAEIYQIVLQYFRQMAIASRKSSFANTAWPRNDRRRETISGIPDLARAGRPLERLTATKRLAENGRFRSSHDLESREFRCSPRFEESGMAAFSTQVAILAWLSYRDLRVRLGQTVIVFSPAGMIWLAPFFPPIVKRRR